MFVVRIEGTNTEVGEMLSTSRNAEEGWNYQMTRSFSRLISGQGRTRRRLYELPSDSRTSLPCNSSLSVTSSIADLRGLVTSAKQSRISSGSSNGPRDDPRLGRSSLCSVGPLRALT